MAITSRWVTVITNIPIAFTASKGFLAHQFIGLCSKQVLQFIWMGQAQEIVSCLSTADGGTGDLVRLSCSELCVGFHLSWRPSGILRPGGSHLPLQDAVSQVVSRVFAAHLLDIYDLPPWDNIINSSCTRDQRLASLSPGVQPHSSTHCQQLCIIDGRG